MGWMIPSSSMMPTEALVPASPREGQRFPESRSAFHRPEFAAAKIAPLDDEPTSP